MECDGERDYFYWGFSAAYKACAGKDDGTYILLNKGDEDEYYRCFEVQGQDGKTVMTATSVSAMDYYAGKSCNLDAEDALYTLPSSSNSNGGSSGSSGPNLFYHCEKDSHTESVGSSGSTTVDDSEYEILDPSNIYDFNVIVALQKGTCTSENVNDNSMVSVFDRPGHSVWAECDANLYSEFVTYRWRKLNALNAAATAAEGTCNVAKMDERKVYSVDVEEWDLSTLTQHMKVKCDCEKEDEYIRYCDWLAADELDIELDKACAYTEVKAYFAETDDGSVYMCDVTTPSASSAAKWEKTDYSTYCDEVNEDVDPLDGAVNKKMKKCQFEGKTYVKEMVQMVDDTPIYSRYWYDVNAYCMSTQNTVNCSKDAGSSAGTSCIFMKGFVGEKVYKCNHDTWTWDEITDVQDYCDNAEYGRTCGEGVNQTCEFTNNTLYACCETAAANGETSADYDWVPVD